MDKGSKKIILILIILLFFGNGCSKKTASPYSTALEIENKKIFVEIVNTPEKMRQGLSGRNKLNDNQGMLFNFLGSLEKQPGFWMKDMEFDLDIIWIKDKKIIGITPNISHPKSINDALPLYYPPSDIDMALEVNAGWSKKNKIKIGDEIKDHL